MKKSIIAAILCLCLLASVIAPIHAEPSSESEGVSELVTVTVNFVYSSTMAMVAQPYVAQIPAGSEFTEDITAPKITNYFTPADLIEGLRDGITFTVDDENVATVHFNLEEVNASIVINVFYEAGTATYTVKHYYQNLENDDYGEPEIVQLIGDIDAYTEAVASSRQGFICRGVQQSIVAADGTTVVEMYYDRLYYTVIFDTNGGINGPKPIYAKYGTHYDLPDTSRMTRENYTFAGWHVQPSCIVETDVTYIANWLPDVSNADYTIVFWGQNANDDEYSYLSSTPAHGASETEVTYNADSYICTGAHTHSAKCYAFTCGLPEHSHDGCELACTHTHTAACYGSNTLATDSVIRTAAVRNAFASLPGGLVDGYIYYFDCDGWPENHGTHYYLYFGGQWYNSSANNITGDILAQKNGNFAADHVFTRETVAVYRAKPCTHQHTDICYQCGMVAHTHSNLGGSCYTLTCDITPHVHTAACLKMSSGAPDASLWHFSHSDTITIAADGKSILNVYFDRNEFTLTFRAKSSTSSTVYGTITDRWGANIQKEYEDICASSGNIAWYQGDTGHFTNFVGIMFQYNEYFYTYSMSTGSGTMTYYGKDLNGNDFVMFTVKANFGSAIVTVEDMYEFEGFTINRGRSTSTGSRMNGAKFYYDRNKYTLEFYSATNSTPDKVYQKSVYYEQNLGNYYYVPTNQPTGMEDGAVFYDWYLNPERSGEAFDLSSHKMPASNLAIYARWVNGIFKVETYTDNSLSDLYTYEGYDGVIDRIAKYEIVSAPDEPTLEGNIFVGWFYLENGEEQPFSFTMPITQNYKIYPKFSDYAIVSYTVHYYLADSTTKVADDEVRSGLIGATITEKAKIGNQLNLVGDKCNSYFPEKTSTSFVLTAKDMEMIFYYKEEEKIPYTVRYVLQTGETESGEPIYLDIAEPKVVTDNTYSIVTENYLPIEDYSPLVYQQTMELTWNTEDNVMYFVYESKFTTLTITKTCSDSIAQGQTFLFRIKGTSASTQNIDITVSVPGTGSIKICELPIGDYTVTEITEWSWRYTPDDASQDISAVADTTGDATANVVTFANSKTNTSPLLDAYAFIRNIFG